MGQVDGEEDSVLTWGGLPGTLSELSNLTRKGELNWQKSADAIVPVRWTPGREGPNIKENWKRNVQDLQ